VKERIEIMKRFATHVFFLLCGLGFAVAHVRLHAQQVSPVIQEFNKKARGAIQVANLGVEPKFVTCRAQSFEPNEHGGPLPRSLDPQLNVRLATGKMLLAPKDSRQISYDANPAVLPAWFLVTCRFMPVERSQGITIGTDISSIVIVHGGQLDIRDVAVSATQTESKVEVEVKNNGSGLARVNSCELLGHRKQVDMGSFILYPHQERLVEADWKNGARPETVRIHIGKKRLEVPVN
jgi:hypothetical protein